MGNLYHSTFRKIGKIFFQKFSKIKFFKAKKTFFIKLNFIKKFCEVMVFRKNKKYDYFLKWEMFPIVEVFAPTLLFNDSILILNKDPFFLSLRLFFSIGENVVFPSGDP